MNFLFAFPLHEYGGGGVLSGFLHPLLGFDHLLAMIAVGLLSAQMGGRAIWTVPAAFVALMAGGAALGIQGVALPFVEYGITGSVLALGLAILLGGRTPAAVALIFVALFGLFHGNAHGTELPTATDTIGLTLAYIAGFLIATIGLHLVGALLGVIAERKESGPMIMRLSGVALSIVGVFLILQVG